LIFKTKISLAAIKVINIAQIVDPNYGSAAILTAQSESYINNMPPVSEYGMTHKAKVLTYSI